jgi:hypothetical protein
MKKNILTISLIVLAILALSLIIVSPAIAITWGEPDTEHTNVGAIMCHYTGYGWFPMCSGTLINERVFLTAAHCTYGLVETYGIDWIRISFDQDVSNPNPDPIPATWLEVVQTITHPQYNIARSNPCDVGVLILAEPVTDIEPAEIADEGFLDNLKKEGELRQGSDGADFTVVGYGGTLNWPPPEIEYEDCRQCAVSEYQALLKSWLRLSQNQATGDGGTCYGDSGGPAFWTEPDGTEILVGITSWGDMQTVATGFYYRVDTADTLDFIDEVISGL